MPKNITTFLSELLHPIPACGSSFGQGAQARPTLSPRFLFLGRLKFLFFLFSFVKRVRRAFEFFFPASAERAEWRHIFSDKPTSLFLWVSPLFGEMRSSKLILRSLSP